MNCSSRSSWALHDHRPDHHQRTIGRVSGGGAAKPCWSESTEGGGEARPEEGGREGEGGAGEEGFHAGEGAPAG